MSSRGKGRGGRGRSRSRGRPRKPNTPPPMEIPLPPSPRPSSTDSESIHSTSTEHAKNYTTDHELNEFIDEMQKKTDAENALQAQNQSEDHSKLRKTSKSSSKSNDHSDKSKNTKSKIQNDLNNPHSAQTKLNQFLTTTSSSKPTSKLQELQQLAAAKANKRIEKAKATSKKKQSKSTSKTKSNTLVENTEVIDSSTDASSDNDDDKQATKKKAKSKSVSSSNYYDPLKQKVSQMSTTERKQYKQIQRNYRTYCGIKVDIPDNDDALATMIKQTSLLFTELQRIDPKVLIYAYNDEVPIHALRSPQDIPDNHISFREFFINAYPRESKGFIWASIWLGHHKPMKYILENMKLWSKTKSSLIFVKPLQVKRSVRDYFLLWSTGRMDKDKLHDATSAAIASLTSRKYNFAFSWIALKNDEGNYVRLARKEANGNQLVKALHVEVPEEERDVTYKMLDMIFGLDSGFKILGMSLLMVPVIRDDLPSHKIDDIQHLVIKQKQFLDQLLFIKTQDIVELDYRHPILRKSIREMIMELFTLDGRARLVFRSIDKADNGEAHYLSYPKYLHDQARDIVTQLPSLLVWLHGPEVLTMLTTSAQERAADSPWDPTEMKAISEEDRTLKRMLQRAKSMNIYREDESDISSSESEVDEQQIQIEFEKQASAEYLFSKASTNASITSLVTKDKHNARIHLSDASTIDQEDSVTDDDASKSDKPSPSKKQKHTTLTADIHFDQTLVQNMLSYFEAHKIDISTLAASSVTRATAAATASIHQDVEMASPQKSEADNDNGNEEHEQDREPSHELANPPGLATDPGDSL